MGPAMMEDQFSQHIGITVNKSIAKSKNNEAGERVTIEPPSSAWEADVLPLN